MNPFQENGVSITPAILQIGLASYPVKNIAAVNIAQSASQRVPGAAVALLGVACLVGCAYTAMAAVEMNAVLSLLVFGVLLTGAGVAIYRTKPVFTLYLATSGGQVAALATKDVDHLVRVRDALLAAISAK